MQTLRNLFAGLAGFGRQLASAGRTAAAVESGHRPADRDLRILGIEPGAFARVLRA